MRVLGVTENGRPAHISPADDAGITRATVIDRDAWSVLLHHGLITAEQHAAASMHSCVWDDCCIVPARSSGLSPRSTSALSEIADRLDEPQMRALRTFRAAQMAVPVFARTEILNVCCYHLKPYSLRHLRIGLSALARHYSIF